MGTDKIKVTWDDIDTSSSTSVSTPSFQENTFADRNDVVMQIQPKAKKEIKPRFIIIPAIVVSILLFAVVFALYSNSDNQYRKAIEAVLDQDAFIPQTLPSDSNSPVETFRLLVLKMRSINLSDCPPDFQSAYRDHIDAWESAIPILQQAEEQNGWGNILKNIIVGFVSGYTGHFELMAGSILSDLNASDELKAAAEGVDKEIQSSFLNVLQVAQKYKVNTIPYAQP